MAGLQNLNIYEAQIMNILCTNTTIQELLDNNSNDYDPNNIKWSNIRPDTYIPETTENAKTYITYSLHGKTLNKTDEILFVDFYIFCHKSLMRTDQGKRTTLIARAIDKEFNGTNRIGLGTMKLINFDGRFSVGKDYHGYEITYAVNDYNRTSNGSNLMYAK